MTIIVFQIKKIILKMSSPDMFDEEKVNIKEDEGTGNANLSSVPSSPVDKKKISTEKKKKILTGKKKKNLDRKKKKKKLNKKKKKKKNNGKKKKKS
jgi:hypothetical protein